MDLFTVKFEVSGLFTNIKDNYSILQQKVLPDETSAIHW